MAQCSLLRTRGRMEMPAAHAVADEPSGSDPELPGPGASRQKGPTSWVDVSESCCARFEPVTDAPADSAGLWQRVGREHCRGCRRHHRCRHLGVDRAMPTAARRGPRTPAITSITAGATTGSTTRSRTAGPRLRHRERLLWPCDVSLLDAGIVGRSRLHGPRQVTDAHLLALAAGPCAPGARRCSPRASRSTVGPRSPVRPARPFSRRQSANCRQQHRGSVQVWNALVTSSGSHGVSVGTRSPVQSSSVTSRLVSC